jgi:hypothetical protein
MRWLVLMTRPPPQVMKVVDHLWGHHAPVAPECVLEEWCGVMARETASVPGQAPCQTQLEVVAEASQQG